MSAGHPDPKMNETRFSFIEEEIIPKKENNTRKIITAVCATVILGAVFGLTARFVFDSSGNLFRALEGKSGDRTTITFPTTSTEDKAQAAGNEDTKDTEKAKEEKQTTVVNNLNADVDSYVSMYNKIGEVAASVNKSIVTVTSAKKSVDWFNNDYESKHVTSGIILANDGSSLYILTNYNKLSQDGKIKVTFGESSSVEATYQSGDSEMNLAVVTVAISQIPKTTLERIAVAKLGESYMLSAGDPIMALGNTNGYSSSMGLGIVTNRQNSVYTIDNKIDLFNTDIEDNPNGDGVIANLSGEIVGVITQKFKTGLNKDINTAISISKLKPMIEKLVNKEPMAYLGIVGADMSASIAEEYGLISGIYVTEVKPKSPAFQAGIKSGDIVYRLNDANTVSVISLNGMLADRSPEDEVTLKIRRTTQKKSTDKTVHVTLGVKK